MNFVEELRWRGMIQDMMPGTEEELKKEVTPGYVGIDPTADSLHIGHLVGVMMLRHLQVAGHKPIALIGGATGMIGDPSGKSEERNLLDEKTLRHNKQAIKNQLRKFLDFDSEAPNRAELVNNYDWMKGISFLEFIRDIGKHITVNYMIAKDSVRKRLDPEKGSGMSFTEFTYQLVQGNDFLYLYNEHGCKLQMGGSDQWGNIITGTELIRRKMGGEAFALTCPLITKADGGKFGKTEEGNVWLDPKRTSAFRFYQFWINISDIDAEKYIKIFTLLPQKEIEQLINEHRESPHKRLLQSKLAQILTTLVHSADDYENANEASSILFGKGTTDALRKLPDQMLVEALEGVPQGEITRESVKEGMDIINFLSDNTGFLASKGEARRALKENSISINKEKVNMDYTITEQDLLREKYILAQRGKKNYFLVKLS